MEGHGIGIGVGIGIGIEIGAFLLLQRKKTPRPVLSYPILSYPISFLREERVLAGGVALAVAPLHVSPTSLCQFSF